MKDWTLRSATTKELAALYGINRKALGRQMKHHQSIIGKRPGYFWSVEQILRLFEILGPPPFVRVVYTIYTRDIK
jgi:hypothetical protein